MPVKEGDKIPSVDVYENTPAGKTTTVNMEKLCAGRNVVVFGTPGAFSPGCSNTHLPGYISESENLKKKGISEIICVSVNDPYVVAAWGEAHGAAGKVRMLSDPAAAFTKALGFTVDLPFFGNTRSKRYSMTVENGVISHLNVEPDVGVGLTCTLASNIQAPKGK